MSELGIYLQQIVDATPFKLIVSNPKEKSADLKKVEIQQKENYFQVEKQIGTQAFHQRLEPSELYDFLEDLLEESLTQLNAFDGKKEYSLRITKKGKVLFITSKNQQEAPTALGHNREKNYIFAEGTTVPPLIDMGIFTKNGRVVPSMYDKFKQINRFIEIIDDVVKGQDLKELTVVDFGCGKSYLTFLLYHYFTNMKKIDVTMIGLDLKKDVIEKCNAAARKYGYQKLTFQLGDISTFRADFPIHMVVTLHACDTATDFALHHAVLWNADMIFSAPCCQKELNEQIKTDKFGLLTRYGILKERLSAELTDGIRANLLTACGYKTQLLEFVDIENTPKNTLIRAVKYPPSSNARSKALEEVGSVISEFHLDPTFLRLLIETGQIAPEDLKG